ncbi:hypothetical protein PsorP6_007321 [Peronosclerospora sorghi]|uniref:Uncharacterized protein n=1 Tax=Peronosclerospora sorghi TaxID=230839 RepID=A0ACC0W905_9STRA|nr:hypothetical protein PsorP6_007321 [Peronosclerospora sorghi]
MWRVRRGLPCTFQNETVVVKQVLPERAREPRWLGSFIEEIRLYLTLQHPKIVRFIGVTWRIVVDISMATEYLPRGDLSISSSGNASESDSVRVREMATLGPLKCKSLLALDIAEALVYLHSFERPIIHWDLKHKNVLLSASWEAKVTDVGASREDDQTLAAEIGTVAWIAPEILRGEHYSEKADVYSFGIRVVVRMHKGYFQARVVTTGYYPIRIAVLVSAGSLRPHVRGDCPQSLSHLVHKCLAYDPVERPSALQLHYELRNLEVERDERVALTCGASCLE